MGAQTKVCPECRSDVDAAARVCPHCGHRFAVSGMQWAWAAVIVVAAVVFVAAIVTNVW